MVTRAIQKAIRRPEPRAQRWPTTAPSSPVSLGGRGEGAGLAEAWDGGARPFCPHHLGKEKKSSKTNHQPKKERDTVEFMRVNSEIVPSVL